MHASGVVSEAGRRRRGSASGTAEKPARRSTPRRWQGARVAEPRRAEPRSSVGWSGEARRWPAASSARRADAGVAEPRQGSPTKQTASMARHASRVSPPSGAAELGGVERRSTPLASGVVSEAGRRRRGRATSRKPNEPNRVDGKSRESRNPAERSRGARWGGAAKHAASQRRRQRGGPTPAWQSQWDRSKAGPTNQTASMARRASRGTLPSEAD